MTNIERNNLTTKAITDLDKKLDEIKTTDDLLLIKLTGIEYALVDLSQSMAVIADALMVKFRLKEKED